MIYNINKNGTFQRHYVDPTRQNIGSGSHVFILNVDMYLHMKGLFLEIKSMISCLPEGNGRNSDLWNVMSIVDQLIFH